MAPRAYWKGYLKLSLVSCPIALFPATSEREEDQLPSARHRVKYRKVDAESGDEVDSADIIKGDRYGRRFTYQFNLMIFGLASLQPLEPLLEKIT